MPKKNPKSLQEVLDDPSLTQKQKYQYYIKKSPEWTQKRNIVLERDNYTCQTCGRTDKEETLTVHHRSYVNLYNEEDNNYKDLITLCKICHHSIHKAPSNWKRFTMDKG